MKAYLDRFFKFLATFLVWKTTIYVVIGSTTVDETFSEWIVCAFQDEIKARDYSVECKKRADEIHAQIMEVGWYNCDREKLYKKNQFDRNMQMDFDGTRYSFRKIELKV